ncbi:hypothetical protein LCGC14_0404780 [marine sediment metagenome]|uniref:Uncharacterized protein n=1 Tax=marine sediment metagenome TaxID=412755 RepID=A0A0F9W4S3_9ZZZZ|nr:MAG: hypothetical protein Lokiarch_26740 [Candidatus Lokiarchaeum sp. GC14_75]
MELKKRFNILLLGLIGPILLIISEFFPWFSSNNLIELFILFTSIQIENSFLFLFPLISGVLCLIAIFLIIYKIEFRMKAAILSFVGLGFQLIFFIDYISQIIEFHPDADFGFYLGVLGFLLIIVNLIYSLSKVEKSRGG